MIIVNIDNVRLTTIICNISEYVCYKRSSFYAHQSRVIINAYNYQHAQCSTVKPDRKYIISELVSCSLLSAHISLSTGSCVDCTAFSYTPTVDDDAETIIVARQEYITEKEGEYPTSLWACVTTLYGGHDLYNIQSGFTDCPTTSHSSCINLHQCSTRHEVSINGYRTEASSL